VNLAPNASMTRSFDEFVSDDAIDGFIYVSSDVPTVASALENNATKTLLANVPTMHARAGYNPPTSSQLRITGTVRRTGNTVGGVKIQITGSANTTLFTAQSGAYVQRVSPGRYTIEPVDAGYVFFPPTRTITITEDDSIGNDFDAALIGPSPRPTLLSISPSTIDINLSGEGSPLLLTATGSDFVPGSKLFLDNVPVATGFISTTTLSAYIPQSFFQMGGTIQVSVRNPDPTFGPSGSLPLAVNNPIPVLASIEPAEVKYNPGLPATVMLVGQNFTPNSIFELTPPCVSVFVSNRLSAETAQVKISLHCAGEYQVRARTPAPGGGSSQVLTFTVK
jgi:IPT/TIG domain-containing protein